MAYLKSFKAYRLKQEWAEEVAALPYDVMSIDEAKEMTKGHPYSFLNIDKPEIHDAYLGEARYHYAQAHLQKMIEEGIYQQDEESLYIYELQVEGMHQYGLVGLVSTEEYKMNVIKKHEKTRVDKEDDRKAHILHCKAHTGPIFLIEDKISGFGEQLMMQTANQKPIIDVQFEDGVSHRIYQMSKPQIINHLVKTFEAVPALYIADGHHRAAAAVRVAEDLPSNEEAKNFLAVIFPKEQLHILAYHRVLKDESHLSKDELFDKIKKCFDVEEAKEALYIPSQKHSFGMRYQGKWYTLKYKMSLLKGADAVASLDVAILQNAILAPIFGIEDPKNDPRIDFVPGIRPVETLNDLTDDKMDIAFSMFPTTIDELIAVADEAGLMPPKSTWFEPKLRSGFFIHTF